MQTNNTFAEENEISSKANGGTEITKRTIAQFVDQELVKEFQIIPSRIRDIDSSKIRIYWQHDLPEDPEVSHLANEESRNRFHKFVFSSNWQMQEFVTKLKMPYDEKMIVIETPIVPFENVQKDFSDKINLVYFSTPHRGLNLLVPVFEELSKQNPKLHLHVFSSFKLYGWDDPKEFQVLFNRIDKHPNMTYHGAVDQEVMRNFLEKEAHVLAYPCTWKETSCRVLMEAMSAGLMCVHPNLSALPDTSGGLTTMYQFYDNPQRHMQIFFNHLKHVTDVVHTSEAQNYLKFTKMYADMRFEIMKVSTMWNNLMRDMIAAFPTVESRAIQTPSQFFHYKVI